MRRRRRRRKRELARARETAYWRAAHVLCVFSFRALPMLCQGTLALCVLCIIAFSHSKPFTVAFSRTSSDAYLPCHCGTHFSDHVKARGARDTAGCGTCSCAAASTGQNGLGRLERLLGLDEQMVSEIVGEVEGGADGGGEEERREALRRVLDASALRRKGNSRSLLQVGFAVHHTWLGWWRGRFCVRSRGAG